jgi:hypothetical protein
LRGFSRQAEHPDEKVEIMSEPDNNLDLQNIMESLESKKGTFKLLWIPMIMERLEKVEKQNKRLSLIATFLLIAVFGLMAISLVKAMGIKLPARFAPNQWVLKGSELHLVTPDDKAMASLTSVDGKPKLNLFDPQSKAGISIGFNESMEPFLSLVDKNGKLRTMLALSMKDGDSPSLQLYDNAGRLRTILGEGSLEKKELGTTLKWPISSLLLFDDKGNVIWRTPADLSAPTSTPVEPKLPEKVGR